MFFQIISIIVLALFYGCYFAKMLSQKKKGIKTYQIGKGKQGLVKLIEITMKVATVLVPISELISIIINVHSLPAWARYAGAVISIFGLAVFVCSVVTMRDSWRAGVANEDKTEIVTDGIYQISRNPAFLGFDLVYIGILMMFFNWPLFAVSAFATLMFHLQIVNVEEDFLVVNFGQEYLNYRSTVNRYIGRKKRKRSV